MTKNSIARLTLTNVITLFNKSIGIIKQRLTHLAWAGAATFFAGALALASALASLASAAFSSLHSPALSEAFFASAFASLAALSAVALASAAAFS